MPMIFPNYGAVVQPPMYPPPQRNVGVNIGRDNESDMFMLALIQSMLGNQQAGAQLAERKEEFGKSHELEKLIAQGQLKAQDQQLASAARMEELSLDQMARSQAESARQAILNTRGGSFQKQQLAWQTEQNSKFSSGYSRVRSTVDQWGRLARSAGREGSAGRDRIIKALQDAPDRFRAIEKSGMSEFEKAGAISALNEGLTRLSAAGGGDENVDTLYSAVVDDVAPILETYAMDPSRKAAVIAEQSAKRQSMHEIGLSELHGNMLKRSASLLGQGLHGDAYTKALQDSLVDEDSKFKLDLPNEFPFTASNKTSVPIEGYKAPEGLIPSLGRSMGDLPGNVSDKLMGAGTLNVFDPSLWWNVMKGTGAYMLGGRGDAPAAPPNSSGDFQFDKSGTTEPIRLDDKTVDPSQEDQAMIDLLFGVTP